MLMLEASMRVVDQLSFGHNGRLYASGAWHGDDRKDNRGIDVWNTSNGFEAITHLFPDHIVNGFVVDPTGRWLYASADSQTGGMSGYFAVDPSGGTPVWLGLNAWSSFWLVIHPSGEWVTGYGCVGNWQTQMLVRWRQHADRPPERVWERPQNRFGSPGHMVCDPDGSRIYCLTKGVISSRDPERWDSLGGACLPGRKSNQLAIAPDGSCLVIRAGPFLLVCDAHDFDRKPRKVRGDGSDFTRIAFHPSGRFLSAASGVTTVNFYNTKTWQVVLIFKWDIGRFRSFEYYGHASPRRKRTTWIAGGLRSVAFSPDGLLAAAGSDTGKIVVWDVDL